LLKYATKAHMIVWLRRASTDDAAHDLA
jgi:hypothetical protein